MPRNAKISEANAIQKIRKQHKAFTAQRRIERKMVDEMAAKKIYISQPQPQTPWKTPLPAQGKLQTPPMTHSLPTTPVVPRQRPVVRRNEHGRRKLKRFPCDLFGPSLVKRKGVGTREEDVKRAKQEKQDEQAQSPSPKHSTDESSIMDRENHERKNKLANRLSFEICSPIQGCISIVNEQNAGHYRQLTVSGTSPGAFGCPNTSTKHHSTTSRPRRKSPVHRSTSEDLEEGVRTLNIINRAIMASLCSPVDGSY
jgi:hypothetical protein